MLSPLVRQLPLLLQLPQGGAWLTPTRIAKSLSQAFELQPTPQNPEASRFEASAQGDKLMGVLVA